MTDFSTRIIKGGALRAETRRLIEVWNDEISAASNLERIRTENLLGLPSRKRTEDALTILRQRFIDPKPDLVPTLRLLASHGSPFKEACYFEATRNDDLLAFASETVLFDWIELGRSTVTTEQLERALLDQTPDPALKKWGAQTRRRVVHGLLSALRDFGILEGRAVKQIAVPHLTLPGFAYAAGRLRQLGHADLRGSTVWHRWLLSDARIRSLFLEGDRVGLFRFYEAGSVIRIDWTYDQLEDTVRAAL